MLNKLRLRLRALFFKPKMEEELDEEVRFHLKREPAREKLNCLTVRLSDRSEAPFWLIPRSVHEESPFMTGIVTV